MNRLTQQLATTPAAWLQRDAPAAPVVLSSRIRLARNLAGMPFPNRATLRQRADVWSRTAAALNRTPDGPGATLLELPDLTAGDRQILAERHVISRDLTQNGRGSGLALIGSERLSLMINEEDHLRLQSLAPGLTLWERWQDIDRLDNRLGEALDFAFDPRLGFLTACPTNVGTGMRASVMLWLPGLALTDGLKPVLRAMSVMNLTVRGLFGEGTEALGFVLQFSNQSTLGESESQILQRLERVVRQLVWSEENARLRLASHSPARLLDLVGRAYGTLFYAHELAAEEALNCLFAVRLGVVTDLFSNLDLATVDELILRTQPGHLQAEHGQTLTEKRAGRLRADRVRKALKDHRPGGR